MLTVDGSSQITMSHAIYSAMVMDVTTRQICASALADPNRVAWERIVDDPLNKWLKDPGVLADEDVKAPSRSTIILAIWLAKELCRVDAPAPQRVVPDGDGGILFFRRDGSRDTEYEIESDGSIDEVVFQNARRVSRRTLYPPKVS